MLPTFLQVFLQYGIVETIVSEIKVSNWDSFCNATWKANVRSKYVGLHKKNIIRVNSPTVKQNAAKNG